jgi:urea carboxylase-associated protein 1
MSTLVSSPRDPDQARLDTVVLSGDGWSHLLKAGEVLRFVDLEGNQAVDTLFYDALNPSDRYDATLTIRRGGRLTLGSGSVLLASSGHPLLTIVADTCGRHDTVGGACSCESNRVRYDLAKGWMHACRDTFLHQLFGLGPVAGQRLGKRDIAHNVNFFMNVPVTPEGDLKFDDGVSGPGRYVELRAERDVLVVVSNCPQLNNPCNGWNPTPIRVLVWDQVPDVGAA